MYPEVVQAVPVAIVDSYSEEMYVESVQAVPVTVVDSIVSRNACGVCTGSTRSCTGQYCQ